jgi:hypothetical protein
MKQRPTTSNYLLCLSNRGYKASLIAHKVYAQLPDEEGMKHGMVRVIDETGEDYLFPSRLFASIDLPRTIRQRLATT